MDQNSRRNRFPNAKNEEPNANLRLPKDLFPKRDDNLCYVKIFGFLKNFVDFSPYFSFVDSGVKLDRKVYRIRKKEIVTVFGEDFEGMNEIYRVSKATIGILSDTESNLLKNSFLDLIGSIEEVITAKELILDKVLKTYSLTFPVIFMPPIVYGNQINIPLHKVDSVLGSYSNNLLKMEMESGAWIKIEADLSSLESEWRLVSIFGPQENIKKAKSLIQLVISEEEDVNEEDGDEKKKKMQEDHVFEEASEDKC